jgi:hypothetical protein
LIYNQHGKGYEEIERILQDTDLNTMFFLKGGIAAYKQFVARQTQFNQGQNQEFTTACDPCAR